MTFGIVNCNKPVGVTSRVAVNNLYRRLRPAKVGHAGTLDPLASGVLLLPVGQASRLTEYLHELPKRYVAEFRLGVHTPSGDLEEQPVALPDAPQPTDARIAAAAQQLTGRIQQVPPAHSAIKIDGRRAYDLVRQGKQVTMKPRTVMIHELKVLHYRYPDVRLEICCGSGTYVRSIGVDLAAACDTVAVMTSLVRTAIGDFTLPEACSLEELREGDIDQLLLSPLRAVPHMPRVECDEDTLKRIEQGQVVELSRPAKDGGEVAAIDAEQNLRAVLVPRGGGWRAKRSFHGA